MNKWFYNFTKFVNRNAMIGITIVSLSIVVSIFGSGWIISTLRCPNCGITLGMKKRYLHRVLSCQNCQNPCWICPTLPGAHSHKKYCDHCELWYYDCPPDEDGTPRSEVLLHGDGICNISSKQFKSLNTPNFDR